MIPIDLGDLHPVCFLAVPQPRPKHNMGRPPKSRPDGDDVRAFAETLLNKGKTVLIVMNQVNKAFQTDHKKRSFEEKLSERGLGRRKLKLGMASGADNEEKIALLSRAIVDKQRNG